MAAPAPAGPAGPAGSAPAGPAGSAPAGPAGSAAAVLAAALALWCTVGCAAQTPATAPADEPAAAAVPAPDPGPLPPPDALTGVLYRLADPAVPGPDKLGLVERSAPTDAATLDRFATALRDGGFTPVTFGATDIAWTPRPATAVATITVSTTNPADPGDFSFPMEFHLVDGGWQLTRDTAEMLLAFGDPNAAGPGPPR